VRKITRFSVGLPSGTLSFETFTYSPNILPSCVLEEIKEEIKSYYTNLYHNVKVNVDIELVEITANVIITDIDEEDDNDEE